MELLYVLFTQILVFTEHMNCAYSFLKIKVKKGQICLSVSFSFAAVKNQHQSFL